MRRVKSREEIKILSASYCGPKNNVKSSHCRDIVQCVPINTEIRRRYVCMCLNVSNINLGKFEYSENQKIVE